MSNPPHSSSGIFLQPASQNVSHYLHKYRRKKNPEGLNPSADAEKTGLVGKQGCSSKMLHIVSNPCAVPAKHLGRFLV